MAKAEINRGVETVRVIDGGVDSGISATNIEPNQFAKAVNVTFRGGEPTHRPGWIDRPLTWGVNDDETDWASGRFQGADVLVDDQLRATLVAQVGGKIYSIKTWNWQAAKIAGGNNPLADRVWMCQAEDTMVIQDGQDYPYLWDGATIRRATKAEVPVGEAMAYGNGRLWVAKKRSYVGGDLVYADPNFGRRNVLRFTENEFLNEGGSFGVPIQSGSITGIRFVARQNAESQEGGMMVFTQNGIFEFNAPVDRDIWKDLRQPLQTFSLLDFGSLGPDSIVNVNGDLWFRSEDGIRSFFYGTRDFGGWGNTPASTEMSWILNYDTKWFLKFASAVNFDNRLLTTGLPLNKQRGYAFRGLSVIDFSGIAALKRRNPPAWEGFWTAKLDMPILKILSADTAFGRRCWAFVIDGNAIKVLELSRNNRTDGTLPIGWWYETRDMNWNDDTERKRLQHAEMWMRDATGTFRTRAMYRSDEQPCWQTIREWSECVSNQNCEIDCDSMAMTRPVSLPRRGTSEVANTSDCSENVPHRNGYTFQFRFEHLGSAKVKRLAFVAAKIPEDSAGKIIPTEGCGGVPVCLEAKCCGPSSHQSPTFE